VPASALEPPPPTYPSPPSLPGVTATAVAAAEPVQPLRTDVACFAGRTRRGPLASPVRVTDWAAYTAVFGGLDTALDLPYAVRGFFSNGGTALWVLRTEPAGPTPAAAVWPAGAPSPFAAAAGCRIEAASPGGWADGTRVTVRHRPAGTAGQTQVLVRVDAPGESPESFGWLPAAALPAAVSALSRLVRVVPDDPAPVPPAGTAHAGTHTVTLTGGTPLPGGPDDDGTLADAYADAVRAMTQLPEPALLALPDLDRCGVGERHREELADLLVEGCAQALDRLALLDPPHSPNSPDTATDPVTATRRATEWMEALRQRHDTAGLQACAVHWPPLRVPDPLASGPPALRTVPASGHVAGTTARLDRERGAFATPANASLEDVVDLAHVLRAEQEAEESGGPVGLPGESSCRVAQHPVRGPGVAGRAALTRLEDGQLAAQRGCAGECHRPAQQRLYVFGGPGPLSEDRGQVQQPGGFVVVVGEPRGSLVQFGARVRVRLLGGARRLLDGPHHVRARAGVRGGEVAAGHGPAQNLREHVVDAAPPRRRGVVVGDEAQSSVGEDQSAPAQFDDAFFFRGQQGVGGVSEQFQCALQVAAGDVTGRGGHQQGGAGGVGEPGQRREVGVAQPFAGGEGVVEGQVSGALARGEDGRQFGEGERVALGDGEQPVGDEAAQRVRGRPLEQGPCVGRVQWSQPQFRYAGDGGAQGGSGGTAAVFGREEQDDRLFGDAPGHEEQRFPRRRVEQMRVVDREQERTPCGRGSEQSERRRADREPGVLRPPLSGGQQMTEQVTLGCGQPWQIAAVGLDDLVQTRVRQS
jgi:hypothetical protein